MEDLSQHERQETVQQGTKIFRVFEGYGEVNSFSIFFGDPVQDLNILELFKSNGFSIRKGGRFNPNNPLEFEITRDTNSSGYKRDKEISRRVGIDMPHSFTPQEVLSSPNSIVAKLPDIDRGEFKYLLENPDQKVKFIAWALLDQNLGLLDEQKDVNVIVERILNKVSKGVFRDTFIEKGNWFKYWVFEEFIETPGEYNTSFRVVADALGNFHYAQVNRSAEKKLSQLMPIPKFQNSPLVEVSKPGTDLAIMLSHPDSPFYISPKKFVSNIARGAKPILLNGIPVENQTDREVLEDIGIDPDKPEAPKELVRISIEIAKEYRKHYPHVGIDYMQRADNKKFVLLEVNKGPHLIPAAMGLPANTKPEQCNLELIRRMISQIPISQLKPKRFPT